MTADPTPVDVQDATPKPKGVTILVNKKEVRLRSKETTGREIKSAAGIPEDFVLYRHHGDDLVTVANDEQIKVHDHEKFTAVSGQDVS